MTRYAIDVVALDRAEDRIEVRVRLDLVEVWFRDRCQAVLLRDDLRTWLASPSGHLPVDDARWLPAGSGRVALDVPGVGIWCLAPHVLAGLRERV